MTNIKYDTHISQLSKWIHGDVMGYLGSDTNLDEDMSRISEFIMSNPKFGYVVDSIMMKVASMVADSLKES